MLTEKLIVERTDGVAHLILNQPEKRNAIGYEMWQGIGDAMEDFAGDKDIRVVIVSGAGGKAFSAGADISEFKQRRSSVEDRKIYDAAMRRAFECLYNLPKLTIARIDGVCVGGGAELAMDCDILIASDRSRFGITPARLGLGYSLPDIERLVRHLGAKLFLDLKPGFYEVVRRVLGHRSIDTTTASYTGFETKAAARHFDEIILKRRRSALPTKIRRHRKKPK